jgi:predicted SAM-dependent methyltransferase
MVYKLIDTREKHVMTKKQEEAVTQAYERFQPEGSTHIKLPQREHLERSYREGVCCGHAWQPIVPSEETTKFLQATFEETELGDYQKLCSICGALSLWESGELFAYDAIANTEQPEKRDNQKPRRERR